MLRVTDIRFGVVRGVSMGDVSICTSMAFKGELSSVVEGVAICLGSGEGSKGE